MQILIDIPNKRITDLLTTAFESPLGDWSHEANFKGDKSWLKPKDIWYDQPELLALDNWSFEAVYDLADEEEGNGNGKKLIKFADLQTGLQKMAMKSGRHFGDFMNENEDTITGDVFIQYVIFGEVIYG